MGWIVEYTREAVRDLEALDHSQQLLVLKAIDKVSYNPLPQTEGGYGKPLGNFMSANLAGYMKIKLLKPGLRIVYRLVKEAAVMSIIVISVRDDEAVYDLAYERIR